MENNNQDLDSLFISIKNILLQDKNLCNFSRYIDYGKIRKYNDNYEWETQNCVLNDNNKINNSQIVRFVNKIDSRFLESLSSLNRSIINSDYSNSNPQQLSIVYNTYRKKTRDIYYMRTGDVCHELSNLMINIDCNFKIKGISLTPFDFLGKNPLNTNVERDFFCNYIMNNISKLIFVGDKCFLVCVIDMFHNVYVSTKILQKIYELDSTDNKAEFCSIITKLFNVISKCCVYFLNTTISQYFNDIVISPIVNEIYNKINFNIDDKIMLNSLDEFNFSNDETTDSHIKQNINKIIQDSVEKYLNKNYYWSSINFKNFMSSIMNKANQTGKIFAEKAYKNGLKLSNIFTSMGWSYCNINDENNYQLVKNVSRLFRESHIYMYKRLNFIPAVAYMYSDVVRNSQYITKDKNVPYRILNGIGKEKIANDCGFIVRTLFLDVTDGILLCDGKHPNVSDGCVCMGDLKGMVSFDNATDEKCRELITKCENLLTCINYTSAYRHDGENIFLNDEYSKCYSGFDTSSIDSNKQESDNKDQIKELDEASNIDELYDIDENTTQTEQEENVNFEDINNTDEFEEEN